MGPFPSGLILARVCFNDFLLICIGFMDGGFRSEARKERKEQDLINGFVALLRALTFWMIGWFGALGAWDGRLGKGQGARKHGVVETAHRHTATAAAQLQIVVYFSF